jgi:hypothetical protein
VLPPGWTLTRRHVAAADRFRGRGVLAIGAAPAAIDERATLGFALAAGSALTWALYSLLTRRVAPFASWAIGGFAAASAALALLCHALFEPAAAFAPGDALKLAALGLGPMGTAFYLWDFAMAGDRASLGACVRDARAIDALLRWREAARSASRSASRRCSSRGRRLALALQGRR